ncbi:hypothetical protein [Paenibacillus dendritiformis]|uniref:hypothetical protein n=1 Tax=Paenibacillus dendritiformis TaxID=130049 RepID=UPI001110A01F|nr:hypothetical protein [Paenibacillus dendritiformis]
MQLAIIQLSTITVHREPDIRQPVRSRLPLSAGSKKRDLHAAVHPFFGLEERPRLPSYTSSYLFGGDHPAVPTAMSAAFLQT